MTRQTKGAVAPADLLSQLSFSGDSQTHSESSVDPYLTRRVALVVSQAFPSEVPGVRERQVEDGNVLGAGVEPGAEPEPPISNRGVQLTSGPATVGIHWFSFTLHGVPVDQVRELVGPLVDPSEWLKLDYGYYFYSSTWLGTAGVRVLFSPGRDDVHVVLPGELCQAFETSFLLDVVSRACAASVEPKVTRLDVAIDVPDGVGPSPWELFRRFKDKGGPGRQSFRTHSQDAEFREKWDASEGRETATCYIGGRTSDSRVRVYDRRGPVRHELELKGDQAHDAARVLWLAQAAPGVSLASALVGIFRRSLDYVEPGDSCATRRPLAAWWSAIVEGATPAERVPVEQRTVARATRWISGQVAGVFKGLLELNGGDLASLISEGRPPRWLQREIDRTNQAVGALAGFLGIDKASAAQEFHGVPWSQARAQGV